MGRFIVRRLLQSAIVLLGVTLVVFLLLQLVPGDPVRIALGTRYDQGTYDALRARSGLDRPLVVQYFSYVGHALTGDLGVSFRTGQPVSTIVLERLPATLSLALTAIPMRAHYFGMIRGQAGGEGADALIALGLLAAASFVSFSLPFVLGKWNLEKTDV